MADTWQRSSSYSTDNDNRRDMLARSGLKCIRPDVLICPLFKCSGIGRVKPGTGSVGPATRNVSCSAIRIDSSLVVSLSNRMRAAISGELGPALPYGLLIWPKLRKVPCERVSNSARFPNPPPLHGTVGSAVPESPLVSGRDGRPLARSL